MVRAQDGQRPSSGFVNLLLAVNDQKRFTVYQQACGFHGNPLGDLSSPHAWGSSDKGAAQMQQCVNITSPPFGACSLNNGIEWIFVCEQGVLIFKLSYTLRYHHSCSKDPLTSPGLLRFPRVSISCSNTRRTGNIIIAPSTDIHLHSQQTLSYLNLALVEDV